MKKPKTSKKTEDVIERFISQFQAKEKALPSEYLFMQTTHYSWILTPVRRTGERLVVWYLER